MKILVLGAAGMIGRKLIERLLLTGTLRGETISSIHAFDVVEASIESPGSINVTAEAGDITSAKTVSRMVADRPDVIFHLAAIVSGEAEAEFEKGYRINLDGTQNLFQAVIAEPDYCPRVIYASSIAVFGAPFPSFIEDEFLDRPLGRFHIIFQMLGTHVHLPKVT